MTRTHESNVFSVRDGLSNRYARELRTGFQQQLRTPRASKGTDCSTRPLALSPMMS